MQKRFRMAFGLMLFLVKLSHPDISNLIRELAKVNDRVKNENFKQMLRAVKFVLDTCFKALKFKLKNNQKTTKYGEVLHGTLQLLISTILKDSGSKL